DGTEVDMSAVANTFLESGEVDMDALAAAMDISDKRLQMMVEANIGIDISDGINMSELTDYLDSLGSDQERIEFLTEVIPGFKITAAEGDIGEEVSDAVDDAVPDEVVGETDLIVEPDPHVEETQVTEEEIAGGVPESVEKKVQV